MPPRRRRTTPSDSRASMLVRNAASDEPSQAVLPDDGLVKTYAVGADVLKMSPHGPQMSPVEARNFCRRRIICGGNRYEGPLFLILSRHCRRIRTECAMNCVDFATPSLRCLIFTPVLGVAHCMRAHAGRFCRRFLALSGAKARFCSCRRGGAILRAWQINGARRRVVADR